LESRLQPRAANLAPGGVGKIRCRDQLRRRGHERQVTISDKLPAGLKLKKGGISAFPGYKVAEETALQCDEATLTCTTEREVGPATKIKMILEVEVQEPGGTETTLQNEIAATGGGATPASVVQPVRISPKPPTFSVEKYAFTPEEEDGTPDFGRAASVPATTTLALSQNSQEEPVEPKDVRIRFLRVDR
jgi:hypothetical protein